MRNGGTSRAYYAQMARALLLVPAIFLLAATGCDPDPASGTDAGPGVDAGPGGADAGGATDAGAECVPSDDEPFLCESLEPDPSCDGIWVVGVTGAMQTAAGDAVVGGRAQLCVRLFPDERLVCLRPATTDDAGGFAIVVPDDIRCLTRAEMRALAPGQGLATTYCPVEFTGAGPIFDLSEPYVLHPVLAATVPPVGDETAARDVPFADGLVLNLAPDDFFSDEDYLELAGAPVDVAATACFADGETFDGAYVFEPEGEIGSGAAVSIPNASGLAPGAVVDLYILGGLDTLLLDGTMVAEGEVATIGTATVSADGTSIESDDGTRIPYLSWLLWRAR